MPFVLEGRVLPRASDIPDSAFYCVECGPTNTGLDCDLPGHGEFALLADLNVRECPLCPPWVECAHFGDQCVRLSSASKANALCSLHDHLGDQWMVLSGRLSDTPVSSAYARCPGWNGRLSHTPDTAINDRGYPTEAEARADFERRVALMLSTPSEES